MTKILYIISTLKRGGPVNVLYNLLKYIDRTQFDVSILTISQEGEQTRINDFRELNVSIKQLNQKHESLFNGLLSALKRTITEIDPDIIHTNGFRADILTGFFLNRYKRITSLQNYPYDDYVMTYGRVKGTVMAGLSTMALKRFSVPVTCSRDVAWKMRKKGLTCEVINNAVDLAFFNVPDKQEIDNMRHQLGVREFDFVFSFIGVLTDRKLPQVTIEAFKKLSDQYKDQSVCLVIVGSGELEDACKMEASGYKNILFAGTVSDTRPYLVASNCYVASSKSEGLPMSVVESLALGVPVILSDIGPHAEILSYNSKAGMLVAVNSVEAIFNAMKEILHSNLTERKKAASDLVRKHLNAELMARAYQDYYIKMA
ncbi:glycosyltransferase [Chitinophaga sp. 30R24]|uniref:glycosyltransferase n=1 Tax=Chitinophaga sp. 30R24 TaxID=3248838 RepID=UPI003B90AB55